MSPTAQRVKPQEDGKDVAIVGRKLRWRRRAAGLTVTDLAVQAGISKSLVSMLENGKRENPRADTVAALAAACGCEITDLMPSEPKDDAA